MLLSLTKNTDYLNACSLVDIYYANYINRLVIIVKTKTRIFFLSTCR